MYSFLCTSLFLSLLFWFSVPALADYVPYFTFDPKTTPYQFDWARIGGNPDLNIGLIAGESWSQDGRFLLCEEYYPDRGLTIIKSLLLMDLSNKQVNRIFLSPKDEVSSGAGIAYTWNSDQTVLWYQLQERLSQPFLWRWDTITGTYRQITLDITAVEHPTKTQKNLVGSDYIKSSPIFTTLGFNAKTQKTLIGLDYQVYEIQVNKPQPHPLTLVPGYSWTQLYSHAHYDSVENSSPDNKTLTQITRQLILGRKPHRIKTFSYDVTVFPFPLDPSQALVLDSHTRTLALYTEQSLLPVSQIPAAWLPTSPDEHQYRPSGQWLSAKSGEFLLLSKHLFLITIRGGHIQPIKRLAEATGTNQISGLLISPHQDFLAYTRMNLTTQATQVVVLQKK